jgi:hypothetical protein
MEVNVTANEPSSSVFVLRPQLPVRSVADGRFYMVQSVPNERIAVCQLLKRPESRMQFVFHQSDLRPKEPCGGIQ